MRDVTRSKRFDASCFRTALSLRGGLGLARRAALAPFRLGRRSPALNPLRLEQRIHRLRELVDAFGQLLDVGRGMNAQMAERARHAILEHLLQLVPRAAC